MRLVQSREVRDANARMGSVEKHAVAKKNLTAIVLTLVMAIAASD